MGGQRPVQAVAQIHPVGQTGEGVVHHLVLQPRLDLLAHGNLLAQLLGAPLHPLLQLVVERVQGLGLLAPLHAGGDLVRHKGEQRGVLLVKHQVRAVALHRDHAHHALGAQQGRAQPAHRGGRSRLRLDRHLAARTQLLKPARIHQLGLPLAHDVFTQTAGHGAGLAALTRHVHAVGKVQGAAVLGHQGDVEILGVDQLAHGRVQAAVELVVRLLAIGECSDAVQRGLQVGGALALGHLRLQLLVGLRQLACALQHAPLQRLAPVLAFQRGQHMLGHKAQHRTV